jgi:hypothetical protein
MSEWQPIETAPKDGTFILVYGYGDYHHAFWLDQGNGFWFSIDDSLVDPTHWMPLPSPPGDA